MAIKNQKTQQATSNQENRDTQHNKLHSTIWKIANDLRGQVDGWDFKAYVLGFLFYRYISENFVEYANNHPGATINDYSKMSDQEAQEIFQKRALDEKGFFILPSELFMNVKEKGRTDQNINQTLDTVFKNIQNRTIGTPSQKAFNGLFADIDTNSPKLGTTSDRHQKLNELLNKIGSLELGNGNYTENSIDVFGSAYEFLMRMYANGAGKSGGEFYTPQEVAELLTDITLVGKTSINKVYDPACGSGGLLLNFAKKIGKNNVKDGFYGQEKNLTTYNLCRFNMFLHNLDYSDFNIANGDTLINPDQEHLGRQPFEAIVSNPPYSTSWAGEELGMINDDRFAPAGVLAPKAKADFAFIMHSLSWLAPSGTAAIVVFPGILYRKGTEQKIRKYLLDNNFVDCIIALPADLFFGVTITACIMVLKKSKNDNHVLFIDAQQEFKRGDAKNVLQTENQQKILKVYTDKKDIPYFARLVSQNEIAENDYNLSVSSYVNSKPTEQDIDIKELNQQIDQVVQKQMYLREELAKILTDLEA